VQERPTTGQKRIALTALFFVTVTSVGCGTSGHKVSLPLTTEQLPNLRRSVDGRRVDVEHVYASGTESGRPIEILQTTTGEAYVDRPGRSLVLRLDDGQEKSISLLATRRISDSHIAYGSGIGTVTGLLTGLAVASNMTRDPQNQCYECAGLAQLGVVLTTTLAGAALGTVIGNSMSIDWTFWRAPGTQYLVSR
jgi:hypothetical protein